MIEEICENEKQKHSGVHLPIFDYYIYYIFEHL